MGTNIGDARAVVDGHVMELGSPISVDPLPGCSRGAYIIQFEVFMKCESFMIVLGWCSGCWIDERRLDRHQ